MNAVDQDGSKGAALDVCATTLCKLETLAGMWRESYRTVQGMLGVSAPRLFSVDCRCFSLLFLLYSTYTTSRKIFEPDRFQPFAVCMEKHSNDP
jgi:hypothetical protein